VTLITGSAQAIRSCGSIDTLVTTWTLCSNPMSVPLKKCGRVLKASASAVRSNTGVRPKKTSEVANRLTTGLEEESAAVAT